MHSVLFVCTANICRSPIAMGELRQRTSQDPSDWRIESAGTWAVDGEPAAPSSVLVLEKRGISIHDHQSRPVTAALLDRFQLILTMEKNHKESILIEFPRAAGRVFLLSEMAGETFDIPDPIGRNLGAFEETAELIDDLLVRGYQRIRELSSEGG